MDWSLKAGTEASILGLVPQSWNWSLEAEIGASKLRLEPQGCNLSLKARIGASRLNRSLRGAGGEEEGEEGEGGRENLP